MAAWVARIKKEKEAPKPKEPKVKPPPPSSAPIKLSGKDEAEAPPVPTSVEPAVQEGLCFSCDEAGKEENPLEACSQCGRKNHKTGCMSDVADGEGGEEVLVCAGCKAKFFGEQGK